MYQKPDFLKISLKVKDVFANYSVTGCAPNTADTQGQVDLGVGTCSDVGTSNTWVSLGLGASCYTEQNP
ncbi:MAG: hypothetical protein Q4A12_03190 [Eubacteriales bacterium]|nr:hypothetical protein [Eubacteriales bacterium]